MSVFPGRKWLLLLLSDASAPEGEAAAPLDPIRIQKGMFLLSVKGPDREAYSFEPYNWGPFSKTIYSDLDALNVEGLVEKRSVPGRAWSVFSATEAGGQLAAEFAVECGPEAQDWVRQMRAYLENRSFVDLLQDIYAAYPNFAVASHLIQ